MIRFTTRRTKSTGRLRRSLRESRKTAPRTKSVDVGFYDSAKYQDGTPVTNVAAWNEFGTMRHDRVWSPSRPFFRIANRKSEDIVRKYVRTHTDPVTLNITRIQGNQIGNILKNEVQRSIRDLREPPNSPVTIALKKGKENPLINTGFLRRSVTWKINQST